MTEEKFEEEKFMKNLVNLKDTQESIQGFSGWCIRNRKSAYKMARCWIKVIKKVRVEQKLVLFYLVNDIVQHSAKRAYGELLDKFRSAIKEAMPHLKDEKIGPKVQRCLDIWEEREVFDKDFIQDLTSLIDLTPVKEDQEIVENFQPPQLCTQIKVLKALEDDADYKLKTLKENELDIQNIEEMKLKLKDKHCGAEFVQEFEDGTKRMEQYIKAMEREIRKRRQVIELLGQGKKYYESVFGEAEIVATAYSNFGNRVNKVKQKLSEKIPSLGRSGSDSPVPSPDYDAPSPEGSDDEMEIKLPDEGGPGSDLSSRLSGMNYENFATPNKDRYSISEFLTKMAHGENVDVDSFISGGDRKRRRTSGSGGGYDPATAGMFDTPQPRSQDPWSDHSQPPLPDWLSGVDEGQEVENVALARLKQAAHKNNKGPPTASGDNALLNSNLVSLTGSAALKSDKERRVSDMELSDGENGDSRHPAWDGENGRELQPNFRERFSGPPPPLPHQPHQHQHPGYNGNHDPFPPPALPRVSDLNVPPANFAPFEDSQSSESGRGRGGFRVSRGDRGGFGVRGGFDAPPRFPGAPGKRFPGPNRGGGFHMDRFSEATEGPDGGFRGRGFRGHHKDFDSSRGGFDRGRGGRGGWNNNRRPWGNPRGRGRANW